MLGYFILIVLGLLYPVRFVWQYGHDWALSRLLGWGIHRTELELHQLYAEQRDKANRRSGKKVRHMNRLIKSKQAQLKSLTSLQFRLGVVRRNSKALKQTAKLA